MNDEARAVARAEEGAAVSSLPMRSEGCLSLGETTLQNSARQIKLGAVVYCRSHTSGVSSPEDSGLYSACYSTDGASADH